MLQSSHAELEQRFQSIQEQNTAHEATIWELRSHLKASEVQRTNVEAEGLHLSERLGQISEQLAQMQIDREEWMQAERDREGEQTEVLQTKIGTLSERKQEYQQMISDLDKENALLNTKVEALEYQRNQNEQRIAQLEAYIQPLSTQLAEKEGRARAAAERSRLIEGRFSRAGKN